MCNASDPTLFSLCAMEGAMTAPLPVPAGYICESSSTGGEFVSASTASVSAPTGPYDANAKVVRALQRARDQMFSDDYIPWQLHPFGTNFEPSMQAISNATNITTIMVVQTAGDPARAPLVNEVDESYTLSMSMNGTIMITAQSSFGCLNGLQTLTQLFYQHSAGPVYSPIAPVMVSDTPKFGHRGLNLDVARHWFPKQDVIRTIDGLSYNKMNRLHLHATDSQSWPLFIPAIPELAEKGAYAPGLFYTPEDLDQMLSYAEDRGIQLIIETDMPGHTNSIAYSHPELIVGSDEGDWQTYAAEPPSGQLKLNDSRVQPFLRTLLDDLLPRVGGYSQYYHTGGDEFNQNVYLLEADLMSNKTSVIQPLDAKIVEGLHAQLAEYNMTPIVWQDQLLTWNVSLSKNTLVQAWITQSAVKEVIQRGYRVIAGVTNHWYLDCGAGQWITSIPQHEREFYPFLDYCDPVKNWRYMYSYDPISNLTAEEAKMVVGAEAHMWTEQTDPTNLDKRLWPRLAAAAEVMWSGRTFANGTNRTQLEATPRLEDFRERIVHRGIMAEPIQALWCSQRNGQCLQ